MTHTAYEMIWLNNLLMEIGFKQPEFMPMHGDNQYIIYSARNPIFHERTKHIEVDRYFVRDAWFKKVLAFWFTPSMQLADLIKAALPQMFSNFCN